jgi:type IV secretory pathway VirB2 component (pilin)
MQKTIGIHMASISRGTRSAGAVGATPGCAALMPDIPAARHVSSHPLSLATMAVTFPKFLRTLVRYGLFVFGVYLGVAIIIDIDVNASLAAIDPANPNTWPEMGPQVRYFLVPVIGTILAVVAVCLNAIVGLFHRRDFHWAVWPILGVAYSIMLSALPLGRAIHIPMLGNTITVLLTVLAVAATRIIFGKKNPNGG